MRTKLTFMTLVFIGIISILYSGCGSGTASYSVTYNGNENTGGSVPVDTLSYANGATVTVLGNTGSLVRTDYYFERWNTQADGEGTNYDTDDTFTIGTANVILYAKWGLVYSVGDTGPAGGLIFYD